MSLSIALSSAMSGLAATQRAAETVSNNVANAGTDGYGRRELVLGAQGAPGRGNGVAIVGIARVTDSILISDRRTAQAGAESGGRLAAFYASAESAIGTPESATSIGKRVDTLEAALASATARPDNESRLSDVLDAAKQLAAHLNRASAAVQDERARADDRIAGQVTALNDALAEVATLNRRILRQVSADRDASPLMDQRQQVIDRIAAIVPLREQARENGQIALVTAGGALLVDSGRAAQFDFTPAGVITPDMTVASGALSGLTLNGRPVIFGGGAGAMDGGTLAADFRIRDGAAVEVQAQLDAVARDLVTRLAAASVDPTLAAGDAGLLTDAGAPFSALNETGLAGRIAVNTAVDPAAGGQLWRLRDGIGATAEGPSGKAGVLATAAEALSTRRVPQSGGFGTGARSAATLVSDMLSRTSQGRIRAEAAQSAAASTRQALRTDELALGVDSDRELQDLLLIERAYAANAKVISSVDEMLKLILGI